METTLFIFIAATIVNVILAAALYGKLSAVNSIDEILERLCEVEDYIQDEIDSMVDDSSEDVDCKVLEQRIATLEKNMIQDIAELSELRTMLAKLNQHVAEVAAFADRVNARIDSLNDDRPESF